MATSKKKGKRKKERVEDTGVVHVKSSFNNTLITVTDNYGNTISWASAGKMGLRGSRKNTPFAAQLATDNAVKAAMALGLKKVSVEVRGPGGGRDGAVRAIAASGLSITTIRDVTPLPHNGCRPPKRRRV
ncbi:MAG: 30S ribosomal protein S11 [Calditrichaeota bacterium]|nr:30S ribosomal protein S11 [Calditrichota bacterium]MCB9366238.1 30S ribosomal protein S11 [Calditrichota bacterium]MCB9391693.1 30S ribosomal protein S11 [Calditrichota bacterium]